MRMIAAATFILLPLAAGAAQPRPSPPMTPDRTATPAPSCDRFAQMHRAEERGGAVLTRPVSRAQRLGELPPGDLRLTVMRLINGCVEPVIVREGIGAFGERRGGR